MIMAMTAPTLRWVRGLSAYPFPPSQEKRPDKTGRFPCWSEEDRKDCGDTEEAERCVHFDFHRDRKVASHRMGLSGYVHATQRGMT